jgi:hypothetical protein
LPDLVSGVHCTGEALDHRLFPPRLVGARFERGVDGWVTGSPLSCCRAGVLVSGQYQAGYIRVAREIWIASGYRDETRPRLSSPEGCERYNEKMRDGPVD